MKRQPPNELREEHSRLRAILADHKAMTYGTLRGEHGFQPSHLEYAYQTFPEVFAPGITPEGRPTIRLLDTEAETFELQRSETQVPVGTDDPCRAHLLPPS